MRVCYDGQMLKKTANILRGFFVHLCTTFLEELMKKRNIFVISHNRKIDRVLLRDK